MSADLTPTGLCVEGTPYFRRVEGALRRALRLRLPVSYSGPARVRLVFPAQAREAECALTDGQALVDGPGPTDQPMPVRVTLSCPAGTWTAEAALAPTRLWTLYIAQDKHLDYGWIHPVEDVAERMNLLLDYHLDASGRAGLRWNLDTARWVEEYVSARPAARVEQLMAALRSGTFEVSAVWLVPLAGLMGVEEILHSLSVAHHLEKFFGIPVRTASLQEVPSLPWGLATILAGAGLRHVVKGAYDLRNPHLGEREPLPLSAWEGPDGSRVLLKWDTYISTNTWGGYAEAYKLWRSPGPDERARFVEDTLARYDAYARYPSSAILLAGTGFDEYPQTTAVTEFIQGFNAQGWEYPRLVDATWHMFWQHVEREHQTGVAPLEVPVVRGDWGITWEEWPAQLAHLNTVYRRARETALAAQAIDALACRVESPLRNSARVGALGEAWRGLLQFTEHDFGGITATMADDMQCRKTTYAYSAARESARALQGGMAALAGAIRLPAEGRLLIVANPNSWPATGVVEVLVPDTRTPVVQYGQPGERPAYCVTAALTDQPVASRVQTRGMWPEHYLSFIAADVPAFGYRCYLVRAEPAHAVVQANHLDDRPAEVAPSKATLENRFYRIELDPATGGLRSLWDKAPTASGWTAHTAICSTSTCISPAARCTRRGWNRRPQPGTPSAGN
jgi:alpha-mannosidase